MGGGNAARFQKTMPAKTPEELAFEFARSVGLTLSKTILQMIVNSYLAGYTQCKEDSKKDERIIRLT